MRGAEAYAQACAECHGADLGGGDMAPGLAGVQFAYNWHGFSARDLFERAAGPRCPRTSPTA